MALLQKLVDNAGTILIAACAAGSTIAYSAITNQSQTKQNTSDIAELKSAQQRGDDRFQRIEEKLDILIGRLQGKP